MSKFHEIMKLFLCFIPAFVFLFVVLMMWYKAHKRMRQVERQAGKYGATYSTVLHHVSGLPLPKGIEMEMYYGPRCIVFKKDNQEFSLAREKISSIDSISVSSKMPSHITRLNNSNTAFIRYSSTIHLIISYQSGGIEQHITLNANGTGLFVSKVVQDFKETTPFTNYMEL